MTLPVTAARAAESAARSGRRLARAIAARTDEAP
jgi:hypothetical protein